MCVCVCVCVCVRVRVRACACVRACVFPDHISLSGSLSQEWLGQIHAQATQLNGLCSLIHINIQTKLPLPLHIHNSMPRNSWSKLPIILKSSTPESYKRARSKSLMHSSVQIHTNTHGLCPLYNHQIQTNHKDVHGDMFGEWMF